MKTTLTKKQKKTVIVGDNAVLKTSMAAKVTSSYQSISYQAGIEVTVPTQDIEKGFEEAWALCENQLTAQLEETETQLAALQGIAENLADRD